MRKLILLLALVLMPLAAMAQNYVQLWNKESQKPVTTTDPLQVTLISGSALVGVKGNDATTISTNTNPLPVKTQTVAQANISSFTAAIPNADTAVALVASSTHLTIKTDPTAAIIYVDLANTAATSADFRIDPGASISLDGLPGISSIHIIGAAAVGTYSVASW